MKKKLKIFGIIVLAIVLYNTAFFSRNYSRNSALCDRLKTELDDWVASLPQVADDENGAPFILKGLEMLDNIPADHDIEDREFVIQNKTDEAAVLAYLDNCAEALALIEKGIEYDISIFPIDYDNSDEMGPNFVASLRTMNLLRLKGAIESYNNRHDKALEEYLKIIQLGGSYDEVRFIITGMLEIALYINGFYGIIEILSEKQLDEKTVANVLAELIAARKRYNPRNYLEGEYYGMKKVPGYYMEYAHLDNPYNNFRVSGIYTVHD